MVQVGVKEAWCGYAPTRRQGDNPDISCHCTNKTNKRIQRKESRILSRIFWDWKRKSQRQAAKIDHGRPCRPCRPCRPWDWHDWLVMALVAKPVTKAVTQCPNPHRPSAGLPGFQGSGFKIPPGLEEFAMIMIIYANIYAISCFMPLLCNCHALSCWSLRCSLHCISVFQSVLPEVFGVHHKVSW